MQCPDDDRLDSIPQGIPWLSGCRCVRVQVRWSRCSLGRQRGRREGSRPSKHGAQQTLQL